MEPPQEETGNRIAQFVDKLSNMGKKEGMVIVSDSMKSVFHLTKMKDKPPQVLLEAIVLTSTDPPVLHVLTTSKKGTAEETNPGEDQQMIIKQYAPALRRSLTSLIQAFHEVSIGVAAVVSSLDGLDDLEETTDRAKKYLPASRQLMTEAAYDSLVDSVAASLAYGAFLATAESDERAKSNLIRALRRDKWRLSRTLSGRGRRLLRLPDPSSPAKSAPLGKAGDVTKHTVVICSDMERDGVKDVLRDEKYHQPDLSDVDLYNADADKDLQKWIGTPRKPGVTLWKLKSIKLTSAFSPTASPPVTSALGTTAIPPRKLTEYAAEAPVKSAWMATGTGEIREFLLKEGVGDGAITAVEEYGVHSYEDFLYMTEEEFDSLENAKPFEKNRLKKLQKAEEAKSASRAPGTYVVKGVEIKINNVGEKGCLTVERVATDEASKLFRRVIDTKSEMGDVHSKMTLQDIFKDEYRKKQTVEEPEEEAEMVAEKQDDRETERETLKQLRW